MRRAVVAFSLASSVFVAAMPARAHFYIDYPDASYYPGPSPIPWWHEDSFGNPQKLGPCGDEYDGTGAGGGPTYVVTPYAPGQTVTLQWTEVISHTGWFRIALAPDRKDFVDPPVLVAPNGNSADAGIENPPVPPVLADGIYPHPIGSAKTWPPYSITLPNTPCPKCSIQIIQIMLDHPSNLGNLDGAPNPDGFLYHHCIDISIGPVDGGQVGVGDGGQGTDGSAGPPASSSSGCGCSLASAPSPAGGAAWLLGLTALLRRRRTPPTAG